MYRNRKRVGAFFLAFVLVFSMVGTALAAYDPGKVAYPRIKDGKVIPNDFTESATRMSKTPIWVLSEFKDQKFINAHGGGYLKEAINEARETGVALGNQAGNFDMNGKCTAAFMLTFIDRYFHDAGVRGRFIGDCQIDFTFISDGRIPDFPQVPPNTILNRRLGILYAALEADSSSPGLQMSDFSSTTLGEYTKPRKTPNGGSSIDIWPHTSNGLGFENKPCKKLNYFTQADKGVFTDEYCQAANLLMYTGVLKGYDTSGLHGMDDLWRGQMVKILVTLAENIDKGVTIPEEVHLSANLNMSADDVYLNYKDLDNGARGASNVTFDGSRSEGQSFEITGTSNAFGPLGTISNSSYGTKLLTFTKDIIMKIAREPASTPARELVGLILSDTVYGTITATASGKTATDSTRTDINIRITNRTPTAQFVAKTDRLTEFAENFFYIKNPVTITDSSSDPEAPLRTVQYGIFKDGACVATIKNFNIVNTIPEFVDQIKPNNNDKTINLTFMTPGIYTIKVVVTDECGAQAAKERTIVVTGEPAAPTAIIRANKYAFIDTPTSVCDASTDPNNDIVQWNWAEIQFKDKEILSPAVGITKVGLQDGKGASKPASVDGTLTFSKKGLYQLGLSVTDATDFNAQTTAFIKVIENIPVPDVKPGPVNPDPDPNPNPSPSVPPSPGVSPSPGASPSPDPTTPPYENGGYPYWEGDSLVIKQNRLFTMDLSNSLNPPASPIFWDKTEWIVKPIDGYNVKALKLDKRNSTEKINHYLAKDVGEFTLTVILHNKFSDDLAISDPTNEDLMARERTIRIKVLPDIKPLVALQVEGAHPNFHENPSFVNVKVVATATSLDHDPIDYYDWTLVRDSNNNNVYTDDTVLQSIKKAKQSQISLGVQFQPGNTSPYQAKVKVTEKFGQPTINEFIKPEDFRDNETTQIFDVNWRPCVSYTIKDFAYTDDTLTIQTTLKDENVKSCTVEWSLWKKAGETYTLVPVESLPIWALNNDGGQLQIPTDGFYRLQAVITDKEGNTETFYPDKDIRIYHLPVAVISDTPEYRWKNTPFQFKESRKFKLDGNSSYVDDSTGKALHQLERSKDLWSITPLDGQDSENIYVSNSAGTDRIISHDTTIFTMGANQFDETLAILDPGRYQVTYQVINTFGKKSPVITQTITIDEDLPPKITGIIEPIVKRGSAVDQASVILSIGNLQIESADSDLIESYKIELAYDTNNDGLFTDESWLELVDKKDYVVKNVWVGYVQLEIQISRENVGNYRFNITAKEQFGQETLPFVPESEIKTAAKIFNTKLDNVSPTGTFSTKSIIKGDVVFALNNSGILAPNTVFTFGDGGNTFNSGYGTAPITLPTGTYSFECWGAQGGGWGGQGGYSYGELTLAKETTFQVFVGGQGSTDIYGGCSEGHGWGGYNGGGNGWYYNSSGGGASDIRLNGERIIIAGGGGGSGNNYGGQGDHYPSPGGAGGGVTGLGPNGNSIPIGGGQSKSREPIYSWYQGRYCDGSAPSGEDFGHGGGGGGGGGGYEWGRPGAAWSNAGGGGGSGYVSPLLQNGKLVAGGRSGNGYVKISFLGMKGYDDVTEAIKNGSLSFENKFGDGASLDVLDIDVLPNIEFAGANQKSLTEALSDVSWRDGAERFIIYVDSLLRTEMDPNSGAEYAKLLSSLMSENIHLIGLGSTFNESSLRALTSQLPLESTFTYNSPAAAALDHSANFIKSNLLHAKKDTMYILLNDKLTYNKEYSDYNGDPQWFWNNSPTLAQRWKYYHSPTYFDNSLGTADFTSNPETENWLANEVQAFDRTGKYLIDYQIKDNPVPDKSINSPDNPFHEYRYWSKNYANDKRNNVGEIVNPYAELYVHRKPVADFSFVANKINGVVKNITVAQRAYDLDHEFTNRHKGLNLYEWKWKFASDVGWRNEGLFSDPEPGVEWLNEQLVDLDSLSQSNILIQYRVRDIDGFVEQKTIQETRKVSGKWVVENRSYNMHQGVWSDAKTVWVTNEAQIPVARFKTTNNTYVIGETIEITDSSYSPNGDNIAKWEFTVTRNNGPAITFTYNKTKAETEAAATKAISAWINKQKLALYAENNRYQISLIVTDSKRIPLSSDPYTVNIQIISINHPPDVTVPDTDKPNVPGGEDGGGISLWGKNNPTIYEYDIYDADKPNPYYTVGGAIQKRGSELLNWTFLLDDPDNHDEYGDANDTINYEIIFKLDRYLSSLRSNITSAAVNSKTYPSKVLTSEQAKNNDLIAPFKTALEGRSDWGAYKITTSVTDVPVNSIIGETVTVETYPDKKPLHLYVIPKLEVIEPHYAFNDIQDNQEPISPGESIFVTATTNDRSTGCRVICKDGEGADVSQELTLAAKNENGTYIWSGMIVLPGDLEEEDLLPGNKYSLGIQTYTTYGSRKMEETREKTDSSLTLNILPLKLYDFKITGITDPAVKSIHRYPITVKDLAFDKTDTTNLMKCGYAVNFELRSKGLKSSTDSVRMRPTFWGYNNGTGQYDIQLDMYYRNDDHKYVKATTNPNMSAATGDKYQIYLKGSKGTLLGTLRELLLPTKVRTLESNTQKWTARYGIPGSAVFVVKGQPLAENNLYRGKTLVMFDFEAMKSGVAKYNYIGKGQWNLERKDDHGNFLNTQKAYYRDGSVLIIDSGKSSLDNYESRPVWTK